MNGIMETSLDDFAMLVVPKPEDEPWINVRAVLAYREEHGLSAEEMTPELLEPFIIDKPF